MKIHELRPFKTFYNIGQDLYEIVKSVGTKVTFSTLTFSITQCKKYTSPTIITLIKVTFCIMTFNRITFIRITFSIMTLRKNTIHNCTQKMTISTIMSLIRMTLSPITVMKMTFSPIAVMKMTFSPIAFIKMTFSTTNFTVTVCEVRQHN
jgi:hypothetical protein